jgi:hypothetical protein
MRAGWACLSAAARSARAATQQQQATARPTVASVLRRSGVAEAEYKRIVADARELNVRARLEQGTCLLNLKDTVAARDVFSSLVTDLEAQRAKEPGSVDPRVLAFAYAGRGRAFATASPTIHFSQVLRDFDTAMRLDPAWGPFLQYHRRLYETVHAHSKSVAPLHGLSFKPIAP